MCPPPDVYKRQVLLNVNAAVYGDAAVAAMSVVGRIFMFVFSFMLGFGQGLSLIHI